MVKDIQVFLGFANFYLNFLKRFRKIAAPLTSILQTTPGFTKIIIRKSDEAYNHKIDGANKVICEKTKKIDKHVGAKITKHLVNFLGSEA